MNWSLLAKKPKKNLRSLIRHEPMGWRIHSQRYSKRSHKRSIRQESDEDRVHIFWRKYFNDKILSRHGTVVHVDLYVERRWNFAIHNSKLMCQRCRCNCLLLMMLPIIRLSSQVIRKLLRAPSMIFGMRIRLVL